MCYICNSNTWESWGRRVDIETTVSPNKEPERGWGGIKEKVGRREGERERD